MCDDVRKVASTTRILFLVVAEGGGAGKLDEGRGRVQRVVGEEERWRLDGGAEESGVGELSRGEVVVLGTGLCAKKEVGRDVETRVNQETQAAPNSLQPRDT